MTLTKPQSEALKWLAISLMVIDHIGVVFFPEELLWRIVGRLAFPLFAFQLAIGYQYTRSHKMQLRNLFLFALISQAPYMWAIQPNEWTFNIFFTLGLAYLLLMAWERKSIASVIFILMTSLLVPVDYGIYGVVLPVIIYSLRKHLSLQVIGFVFLTGLYAYLVSPLQFVAVVAGFLVLGVGLLPGFPYASSKWFFYWFYPAHLALFAFSAYLLG